MSERRAAFILALRDCADFLESHPVVPVPSHFTINVFADSADELRAVARVASWTKYYDDSYFALRRVFGEELQLDVNINREHVCRRIVKGTRVEPERIVEDVEWICDDAALLGEPVKVGA